MKTQLLFLAILVNILLSINFVNCTLITLTNPVLKIVDGVKGLMDANNVHKILYMGQTINKFLNGELDPQTKKRVPQHNLGGKLYTLIELVKIEEEFEKKYGPIYEAELSDKGVPSTSLVPKDSLKENYRDRPEIELEIDLENPENSIDNSNDTTDLTEIKKGPMTPPAPPTTLQNSSYEKEKKNLIDALIELKEKFLNETRSFMRDARGTKEQMFRLIQEWAEKSNRPDSILLGWSTEEEGASFKRNVTSLKKLHIFCLDLTDFLKVLIQSCPKALKAFMKENPTYKISHAKS